MKRFLISILSLAAAFSFCNAQGYVSVADFGAIAGDGTDDTEQIQAALDWNK